MMPKKIKLACNNFNPFQTDVLYLHPLEVSENQKFSDVSWEYKYELMA